jgi:hypothetical protein
MLGTSQNLDLADGLSRGMNSGLCGHRGRRALGGQVAVGRKSRVHASAAVSYSSVRASAASAEMASR